jgi:hypothetical protein
MYFTVCDVESTNLVTIENIIERWKKEKQISFLLGTNKSVKSM